MICHGLLRTLRLHAQTSTCKRAGFACQAVQRDSRYAALQRLDVDVFTAILGSQNVVQDTETLQSSNRDWMGKYVGQSQVILRPSSTQELSKVMAHCNDRKLAVVPQAGNTGLAGGSVPIFDEVILQTAQMNRIHSFDEVSGALQCQAGCILGELNEHLAAAGYVMPLDLGPKDKCQIGGNVSTNAGGLKLIRYGSLHGSVLGLEVVLANGTIIDTMTPLRKDNTGYDVKQLFIGAEGTLGIISGVSILCPPKPAAVNLMFLAVQDWSAALQTFVRAKRKLAEVLSAFEFLDSSALDLTLHQLPHIVNPLPDHQAPFYLLVETSGSNGDHDQSKLKDFLKEAKHDKLIQGGTVASDSAHIGEIWQLRENISVALNKAGKTYKYDMSLPVAEMYGLVEDVRQRLQKYPVRVVGYGHLGDSNVHLNVSTEEWDDDVLHDLEPYVYDWVADRKGSISAEHGLGQMKSQYIGYTKQPDTVDMMRDLKQLLDPNGILNPYKVLPEHVSFPSAVNDRLMASRSKSASY
ncbi:hypothetical protein WJX74_005680 [Apatococcus lobatus]|uniref:D-2-hydroxyglutarate dehydrogenase n=1 Tax=Apatococcus lobatus TaxID=904363 RepID=A0AAW1RF83_9CHLO